MEVDMPTYVYVSEGGDQHEHTCPYDDRPERIEVDGVIYSYSFGDTVRKQQKSGDAWGAGTPIDALELHDPALIREHKRKHPHRQFDNIGRPIATSASDMKRLVSEFGGDRVRWVNE